MTYIFNKLVDTVCHGDFDDKETVENYITGIAVVVGCLWLFVCVGIHEWLNVGCHCPQGKACGVGVVCHMLFFILSIASAVVIGWSVFIYITGKIYDKCKQEKKKEPTEIT